MKGLSIAVSANDHSQGPRDAPITLVEYGDYQCPYCGAAYPVLKAVQRAMGTRMRFVFRNFPITESHPNALAAARFAEAAAEGGTFWEAHDLLYARQDALGPDDLKAYASELGLNKALLDAADNGAFDHRIESDFMGGVRSGVNGTPCLFINGERYDGPVDVDGLIEYMTELA